LLRRLPLGCIAPGRNPGSAELNKIFYNQLLMALLWPNAVRYEIPA
jgi:hypothetical protein